MVSSIPDPSQKENLGIIVQYKVKVKLCLGPLGTDVIAELPFILMHPKPEESNGMSLSKTHSLDGDEKSNHNENDIHVDNDQDQNLIQLDA